MALSGYEAGVALLLLSIPGTPALLAAVLWLSEVVERRCLSPRSLVIVVARSRRNSPEYAEAFVARHLDPILAEHQQRRPSGG